MTLDSQMSATVRAAFERRFDALARIGLDPATGAWNRFSWSAADLDARAWFATEAATLGLSVEVDPHGNLWAWWGDPAGERAVATGSHLDTVPGGGAFDGALGVVAALGAVEVLRERGIRPLHPVAIAVFTEEEGARFGLATLGSRMAAGLTAPATVLDRRDAAGVSLEQAMRAAGHDPRIASRADQCTRLAAFVELHVEQGRALADLAKPLAVATEIIPHGRWRIVISGEGNHAGTTRLEDRRDPMLVLAAAITSARHQALLNGSLATIGRLEVVPNGSNVIPGVVRAWLDARAPNEDALRGLVRGWMRDVTAAGVAGGCEVDIVEESSSPAVVFVGDLSAAIRTALAARCGDVPLLPTGAGHDAGILATVCPTAMLFVRNPTGASHAPSEYADVGDCVAGVEALADVLAFLVCRAPVSPGLP